MADGTMWFISSDGTCAGHLLPWTVLFVATLEDSYVILLLGERYEFCEVFRIGLGASSLSPCFNWKQEGIPQFVSRHAPSPENLRIMSISHIVYPVVRPDVPLHFHCLGMCLVDFSEGCLLGTWACWRTMRIECPWCRASSKIVAASCRIVVQR